MSAEARLRRTVARQGVPAVLLQDGVEYAVVVLSRGYEGGVSEALSGMPTQTERYAIPAYQIPNVEVRPYAILRFSNRNRTVKRADPGYAGGVVVRWDVEVEG